MDSGSGHTLFPTAIGVCGLAWGPAGITAVQLPEQDPEATRARLLKHAGTSDAVEEAPDAIRAAITGVQALLNGEPRQLLELALDMARLTDFQRRAYAIARAIPPGGFSARGGALTKLRMLAIEGAVPGGTPDLFADPTPTTKETQA
jgi:methylated-DNA-[protein]-cysteine S-methyltransferase